MALIAAAVPRVARKARRSICIRASSCCFSSLLPRPALRNRLGANATQKKTYGEADVLLNLHVIWLISGHDEACRAANHKAQKGSRCASRFGHVDFTQRAVTYE